jgi:flagellar basal-body rod protein FlgB
MQGLFDNSSISMMQKSLDALWLRQKLISDNVANIDTPGYKSKSVKFEDFMQNALMGSDSVSDFYRKTQNINPQVIENDSTVLREDGNNVDIDAENVELVKTQIQYAYLSRMISNDVLRIKYVLNEGK